MVGGRVKIKGDGLVPPLLPPCIPPTPQPIQRTHHVVRREQHVVHRPEGVLAGERLRVEDVEGRALEPPARLEGLFIVVYWEEGRSLCMFLG